jgi:hypothetical protein
VSAKKVTSARRAYWRRAALWSIEGWMHGSSQPLAL